MVEKNVPRRAHGRRRARAAFIALVALAITSCGSAGNDTESNATSTAAPAASNTGRFVETARFGRGRATAAASSNGGAVIVATTLGVVLRAPTGDAIEFDSSLAPPIADVVMSPTGRSALFISASNDAELWSIGSEPAAIAELIDLRSAKFTDDGTALLVATSTGLTSISTENGSVIATTDLPSGTKMGVSAWNSTTGAAFVVTDSPEDAVGAESATAWTWMPGGQLQPIDVGDAASIKRAEFDPPHNRLLIGSSSAGNRFEGQVQSWNLDTVTSAWTVEIGAAGGSPIWVVGADGRVLTLDGLDVELIEVDGTTMSTSTLAGSESIGSVQALDLTSRYAIARSGGSITIVDTDGHLSAELPSSGATLNDVEEFAGAPGIVTVDYFGLVRTWGADGTLTADVNDFVAGTVNEVAISPSGDQVGFVTSDGNAGTIPIDEIRPDTASLPTRPPISLPDQFAQDEGNIDTIAFTPDGAALITGVSEPNGDLSFDDTLSRWELGSDTRTFTVEGVVRRIMGCVAFRNTVRFTPDGTAFVAPFHDFTVSIRSADDGTVVHTFPPHLSTVLDVAFSPDGTALVTSSDDWTVRVWNLDDYTLRAEYETAPGGFLTIGFLPDSSSLVVSDVSGVLRILDIVDGSLSDAFVGEAAPAARLAVSHDGRFVAAGSDDDAIGIWDVASGTLVDELPAHRGPVNSVSFSPDGSRLVSGSDDGTIRLWDRVGS